jgi:hypothetical protein
MKFKNILQRFIPKMPSLGRWFISKDPKHINIKLDFSNEDHCGICSNHSNSVFKNKIIK